LQNELNRWDISKLSPPKIVEHYKLVDNFTLNLDESSMAASEGVLHIIGSRRKKKHEKNVADSRESITTVRVGSSANGDGPRFFLAKGKEIELETFKHFTVNYTAPPGSKVIMTANAYMTDEAWMELVPHLCRGIRQMNVIKDHPNLWAVLSLDGFGSHLEASALLVFEEHKIIVIKEEGDTSHVSQAYDQTKSPRPTPGQNLSNVLTYAPPAANRLMNGLPNTKAQSTPLTSISSHIRDSMMQCLHAGKI
jgi:hypothetical protein